MTEKKSGIEVGEYKDKPVLHMWPDVAAAMEAKKNGKFWKPGLSFGHKKAEMILENIPQITAFAEMCRMKEAEKAPAQSVAAPQPVPATANADSINTVLSMILGKYVEKVKKEAPELFEGL